MSTFLSILRGLAVLAVMAFIVGAFLRLGDWTCEFLKLHFQNRRK